MSAEACAALVSEGDPDRFRSAMVAPPMKRPGLMALYAFNLEVARAAWVTSEPMIAQIRLQWWLDALAEIAAGAPPRRHEVVEPLGQAIRAGGLPVPLLAAIAEARGRDVERAPHADRAALDEYIAGTSGNLYELAARHLGAGAAALPAVRRFGQGAGIAALIRALPALRARGRDPLPRGTDVAALARDGQRHLTAARAARGGVPHGALAAMLAGWKASAILRRAAKDPSLEGSLEPAEAWARAALIARALSGRW